MDKVNQFHFILAVCWLLYVVIHSVMAARSFKRMVEQAAGKYYRYYRIVYSITAAVTLILVLSNPSSMYLRNAGPKSHKHTEERNVSPRHCDHPG